MRSTEKTLCRNTRESRAIDEKKEKAKVASSYKSRGSLIIFPDDLILSGAKMVNGIGERYREGFRWSPIVGDQSDAIVKNGDS